MDEQLVRDITAKVLRELSAVSPAPCSPIPIPVGISARHVHLCRKHMDILFGAGGQLTFLKELMGGQFAAAETISIVGLNPAEILKARVLGPLRSATQVEISATDARNLGILAPLRDSGDIGGSASVTLIGPQGAVYLEEGCIVARRHIHMSPTDAARLGLKDKDIVNIHVGGPRGGTLSNTLIRVDPTFTLEMHIDTDEANALGIAPNTKLELQQRSSQC
ncbi:MAG: phosphate propanoyltransferase [Defluviitaleaceae bacterium]|nr:phosphate propanoyltransferase [Defluviitaleaceae bacterium]